MHFRFRRVYGHQSLTARAPPVGGTSPSSSTSSLATSTSSGSSSNVPKPPAKIGNHFQQKMVQKGGKPISSVAPTNVVQKTARSFVPTGDKPGPIYQTSSTKILPVQPQTLGSTPQGVLREIKGELSPPVSSSTPLSTPEAMEARSKKPALPPKPAVPAKPTPPPPPRQAHPPDTPESKGYVEITAESLDQALNLSKRFDGPKPEEVPFESDCSRSPTPPPPPPPTTEPPDDISPRRDIENISKDDKLDCKIKINQSSNLVNSGTQINNNNINNNNNNNNNIINSDMNGSAVHLTGVGGNSNNGNIHLTINRRIEMPPAFMFPENEAPPADLMQTMKGEEKYGKNCDADVKDGDELDRVIPNGNECYVGKKVPEELDKKSESDKVEAMNSLNAQEKESSSGEWVARGEGEGGAAGPGLGHPLTVSLVPGESVSQQIVRRVRKGNLKSANNKGNGSRRVSFDPLALLLDASLEGELELVMKTASQVSNPSAANDEGITALHNAICAGHLEIVKFLVEFGCDVNAQDSDGW